MLKVESARPPMAAMVPIHATGLISMLLHTYTVRTLKIRVD